MSRTSAEADYSVEASSAGNDGRMDIGLNSVLPYVRFAPDEKTDLWAILGAGRGQIENRRPNSQSLAENSDVTLLMAAAGARRALAADGRLGWALLGDFNAGRVETDGGTQAIAGLTVDVRRIRLGVEGSYTLEVEDGFTLTSFMEMSGRHDGGDGEDMYGLELSPGLYLSNPESRIGLEVRRAGVGAEFGGQLQGARRERDGERVASDRRSWSFAFALADVGVGRVGIGE